jgi:16S rRNA (adenine1518-N6/adenine1519-N6)-dimethyltransferase
MKLIQKPKKSLGQNFLVDNNIINKIVQVGNINKNKTIVEIGAGYGNLTSAILKTSPKKIYAIEKDKELALYLKNRFKNINNVKVINNDILELVKTNSFDKNVIVFGNLPYNTSTKILASLILLGKWPPWYDSLVLMFQKEVADRIVARSKTKNFSRLSVLANWRLDTKKHFDVSNNSFFPKPKITSTILSFKPKKNNIFELKNPKNLEKITRVIFSNRRKMINKSLKKLFKNNVVLKNLKINLNKRPEELSNETYYKIAALYEKLFN